MKILLVVPWDGQAGGVVSVVSNLANYLRSQGHEIFFFHPRKTLWLKRNRPPLVFQGVS